MSPTSRPEGESSEPLAAEFVVPVTDLGQAIDGFGEQGFRLDETGPADAPNYARMSSIGLGTRLCLETVERAGGNTPFLRLPHAVPVPGLAAADSIREATNDPDWTSSTVELVVCRPEPDGANLGRAGMRYRDLIPSRFGGAVIASHIHIPEGGPVPDYVHYHHIGFQLIYCHRGWVDVAYEDQGEPIRLEPGDCFLQPPGIRHRVLLSSDDLFVIEVSSPAEHPTFLDHDLTLPNGQDPGKSYGGQAFVFHDSSEQPWESPPDVVGLQTQDLGLDEATDGQVRATTIRAKGSAAEFSPSTGDGRDFGFLFVLDGTATVTTNGETHELNADASIAVPAEQSFSARLREGSAAFWLEAAFS